jgi:hypothetical protein
VTDWTGPAEPLDRDLLPLTGESVGNPGAKGIVYVVDASTYYKEYLQPVGEPGHLDELISWRRSLPAADREFLDAHCAWPLRRVRSDAGTTGFLMSPAPDQFWADMLGERHTVELQHLIHTAAAKRLGLTVPDRPQRLRMVQDLADLLALLDAHDIVYGDISEKNVLWTLEGAPATYLIDCDNARPAGSSHRDSAMARNDGWRDPLLGPDDQPNVDSDRFALAVFFYRVFYGVTVSVDQEQGRVLLPDNAPHLPELERLLGAGLGLARPRPSAALWSAAIRSAGTTASASAGVAAPRPAAAKVPRTHRAKVNAMVAAGLLVAAAMAVPVIVHQSHESATPLPSPVVTTSSPSPSPSPPPTLLTRSEALRAWATGPVKVRVDHYYSWFDWEEKKSDRDAWIYLRASLTNGTGSTIDLSSATERLVLVMDTEPKVPDGDASIAELPGLHDDEPLYGLGLLESVTFTYDGVDHEITWAGGDLEPDATFTSKRVNGNGAAYEFPPSAIKVVDEDDLDIPPGKLHVLGVAWLDGTGEVQGFTPVSAWKKPNSADAFLKP